MRGEACRLAATTAVSLPIIGTRTCRRRLLRRRLAVPSMRGMIPLEQMLAGGDGREQRRVALLYTLGQGRGRQAA